MKLSLTTWQRITLVNLLGSLRGAVVVVRKASKALDILSLSEQEQEQVGYVQRPDGSVRWQDAERRFELEIREREVAEFIKAT